MTPRTCAHDGCGTRLSRYNHDAYCSLHKDSQRVVATGRPRWDAALAVLPGDSRDVQNALGITAEAAKKMLYRMRLAGVVRSVERGRNEPHLFLPTGASVPAPREPKSVSSKQQLIDDLRAWYEQHGHSPGEAEWDGPYAARTYRNHFGSWRAALAAAGLPPLSRRRNTAYYAALFAAMPGTIREIADRTGYPYRRVANTIVHLSLTGAVVGEDTGKRARIWHVSDEERQAA